MMEWEVRTTLKIDIISARKFTKRFRFCSLWKSTKQRLLLPNDQPTASRYRSTKNTHPAGAPNDQICDDPYEHTSERQQGVSQQDDHETGRLLPLVYAQVHRLREREDEERAFEECHGDEVDPRTGDVVDGNAAGSPA